MQTRQMTLAELLPEWVESSVAATLVSDICQDSREVASGALFIARSGLQHRGVDFVTAAVQNGAAAIVIDQSELAECPTVNVPVVGVEDLTAQIGVIAARFFANPSKSMQVIGVTGTNGKTTCAHFLAQTMNYLGVKTAIVGTVGNGFPGALATATHTTPDAVGLQRLFAQLQAQGAQAVVMEVSSHALEQGRVAGVEFSMGLFTNLSRDHLDYHGSMTAYGEAKARLFRDFALQTAIFNTDDAWGKQLYRDTNVQGKKVSTGRLHGDCHLLAYRLALHGIEAEVKTPYGDFAFASKIIGEFNLDNLLLVIAALAEQGFKPSEIMTGLAQLDAVPGRMQAVVVAQKPLVIIDYAHTPDALEKALCAVRAHTAGTLWCVFGCGGDRDQGKREQMGMIADRFADHLVVTSDNPRTEQPEHIIAMIESGICQHQPAIELDRAAAIQYAIDHADKEDVVLIAGKGHEDYQEIGRTRYPFSDVDVSMKIMGAAA